ncbi:MAG: LysR substrate-binding domain-containing protein [Lachnospiraceae bacterium]
MNLQDWYLLTELYKTRSISKASENLFVSQPALTRRLKQIEEEFSAVIILRSSKGISFTSQGEKLVAYSRDMLRQYESIQRCMKSEETLQGSLQIVSSLSQTQFFLPPLLQKFSKLHPNVSFEVESMMSTECIRALNTRKAQVAFYRGEHQGIFEQKLLGTQYAYIVYHQPFILSDLPSMPYISFEADHSGKSIRENWWYNHFDVPPYTAMTVKNNNICYEMVRHGLGFSIFLNSDFWMQNKDLYYQQLFFKDGTPVIRNDYLGYRKEALKLEKISAFVDYTITYSSALNSDRKMPDRQNF